MASFPSRAKVVVIGAGIVGNSVAYHLANLGWRDILLIDKGPLPNPGGSTGHASNFIYLVDHNKEMTALTVESARQYQEWDVYTTCGGLEVARTETGWTSLRRRDGSAKNWHRLAPCQPGRGQRARPVHRRIDPPRRLLHPDGRRRRLAPVRDPLP
jgi:glycine/D-amino acid oxidase-like deaminating enzyme